MLLFVDDQTQFLDAISRHFETIGFRHAHFATTAEEAWKIARSSESLRHIVCDLRMPGGGAFELFTRVHRISPSVTFTLLSAFVEDLSVSDWATLSALKARVVGKEAISSDWLNALICGDDRASATDGPRDLAIQEPAKPFALDRDVFDVFLSYNSQDRTEVKRLADWLRDDGIRVWFDQWELVPGRPWQEALELMIEKTKTAGVLIGGSGFGPWEMPEMRACLSEFVSRRMPVIPILLPGAPNRPILPIFLRQFTWVDMRSGIHQESIMRLKWGITGDRASACDNGA